MTKVLDPNEDYSLPGPRHRIEELTWKFSEILSRWYANNNFRNVAEYQAIHDGIVAEYHAVYDELRSLGWDGGIDVEEELPDELMPAEYRAKVAEAKALYEQQKNQ